MQLEVGEILEGKVSGITKFGAFIDLPDGKTGMVHISEVAATFVSDIHDHLTVGQTVKVKVLTISDEGKIGLSIKKATATPSAEGGQRRQGGAQPRQAGAQPRRQSRPPAPSPGRPGRFEWQSSSRSESSDFEDMMSRFKAASDDRMGDLYRAEGGSRRGPRRGNKPIIPDDE